MPPNIVLIMSDQHNADIMGCAGDPMVRTPNLDALAARGMRLTAMYTPCPLCLPARMGFMTGRHPADVNIFDNGSILASDVPTFAHGLGAAGYETVLCGRMHFAGPDAFHGFERRILGDCQEGGVLSPAIQGSGFHKTNGQTRYAVEVAGHGRTGYQAFDHAVVGQARRLLADRCAGDRPFCLVVGMMLPHNPLICRRDLFEHYLGALPPPSPPDPAWLESLHPAMQRWRRRRGVDDLTVEQNHRGQAAYYGLVEELDGNVGRVLDLVSATPGAADTLVLYCSDHGDMAGRHGMWWKTNFYEGSVRVPCVVSWPGRVPAGAVQGAVTSLIDIGPTLLDCAGGPPLPDAAGRSFRALLADPGARRTWVDEAFSEVLGAHGDQPSCMLRAGPWKMVYFEETTSFQLFNVVEDPTEGDDRAADPSLGPQVEAMLASIRRRWSAADRLARAGRAGHGRAYVAASGHAWLPHAVARFQAAPTDNAFDLGQLPCPPRRDRPPDLSDLSDRSGSSDPAATGAEKRH